MITSATTTAQQPDEVCGVVRQADGSGRGVPCVEGGHPHTVANHPVASPTYQVLREAKGRGFKRIAVDLAVDDIVRVDGTRYAVTGACTVHSTGSLVVPVYSEHNQHDHLYLSQSARITVLGSLSRER